MKLGFVVPVYRHAKTLEGVVSNLEEFGVPIIVVDDGNDLADTKEICGVAERHERVVLVRREKNGGKGKAVIDGVKKALEINLTHVFQIDSDGQHDTAAVPKFLALAEKNPEDAVCGFPQYDESVPRVRKNGREISNNFARFCTLDKNLADILCGFRIYPVNSFLRACRSSVFLDGRMGFDTEILVRMMWQGVGVQWSGVGVTYPKDGVSNFRMVRDNVRISLVFTRLCCGMVLRLPLLLFRKSRQKKSGWHD